LVSREGAKHVQPVEGFAKEETIIGDLVVT
jgi:hypothetical protein